MTRKKAQTLRKTPQKTVTLTPSGREAWDRLKAALEDQAGMPLTADQVVYQALRRVGA